jgi:hypothetical protein
MEVQLPAVLRDLVVSLNRGDTHKALRSFSSNAVVEIKARRAVYAGQSLRTLAQAVADKSDVRLRIETYKRVDIEHILTAMIKTPECCETAIRMHFIFSDALISSLRIYAQPGFSPIQNLTTRNQRSKI